MLTEEAAALRILMNEDLYLAKNDWVQEEKPVKAILPEEPVVGLTKKLKTEFTFVGKNLKNFLILTNQKFNDNQLKALENTLTRKQMSFEDVAIIDFSAYQNIGFEGLHASFMPQKLVCFGLKPKDLGLLEAAMNQISILPNYQILYTYSFTEMLGNKEKTKAFWEAMKIL